MALEALDDQPFDADAGTAAAVAVGEVQAVHGAAASVLVVGVLGQRAVEGGDEREVGDDDVPDPADRGGVVPGAAVGVGPEVGDVECRPATGRGGGDVDGVALGVDEAGLGPALGRAGVGGAGGRCRRVRVVRARGRQRDGGERADETGTPAPYVHPGGLASDHGHRASPPAARTTRTAHRRAVGWTSMVPRRRAHDNSCKTPGRS